jgi:hypothetical protein
LVVAVAVVEARQELAHGKIAGAAEDDEVERFDRDKAGAQVMELHRIAGPLTLG